MTWKIVVSAILAALYGAAGAVFSKIYYTPLTNQVMANQLNDTPESFTGPATYKMMLAMYPYGWVVIAAIVLALFWSNIKAAAKGKEDA